MNSDNLIEGLSKKVYGGNKLVENMWDKSFENEEFVYGTEANVFIKEQAKRFESQSKIACLAEGEGRNAVHLAKLGHNVTAYDISSVGLKKAEQLAKSKNVSINTEQIDLISKNMPEATYDYATLVFGHVHQDDQAKLINNLIRTVKPGGLVMFEVYSKAQINYKTGGPGKLEYLYDPKTICNIIKPYECLHFYYGEAERYEGIRHNGKCHIIQVIIKK